MAPTSNKPPPQSQTATSPPPKTPLSNAIIGGYQPGLEDTPSISDYTNGMGLHE
jgi:hypothetical protein